MSYKTMRKNLRQSILKSLGRYLAIVAIIALGAGIFVGLRTTKSDMVATGQKYMDAQNMFDLRILNTYGWTQKEVDAIAGLEGVADAEGSIWLDAIVSSDRGEDEKVYRFFAIPERISRVALRGGRMPQTPDECLVDGARVSDDVIGSQITISASNTEDTLDSFASRTYTVVGYVSTPLYMDSERGNTAIGNGSLASYIYIPAEGFTVDYFTEIAVTIPGDYQVYTDAYDDAMDAAADKLEAAAIPLADARLEELRADAETEYADGLKKYEDGLKEYQDGKAETERELADAKQKLEDAQSEIDANRKTIEDGEVQIQDAKTLIYDNTVTLAQSRQTLAEAKAATYAQLADGSAALLENYKTVSTSLRQVNSALTQIDGALNQIEMGLLMLQLQKTTAEVGIKQLDTMLSVLNTSIETARTALEYAKEAGELDVETIADLEKQLAELESKEAEYQQKRQEYADNLENYQEQLTQLQTQKEQLTAQREELAATQTSLEEAMDTIYLGMAELQNSQTQADQQFTSAQAQLEAGQAQLDAAKSQLEQKIQELEDGKITLEEAEKELAAGWEDYESGKTEAVQKLADAKAELDDAKRELDDARETIDGMNETSVYVLTRNSNAGYIALDSNSDIVAGVSRVFPMFFLLVAALVCITTMTRMVSEERTQIGTLKALGYGNLSIISKYLIYAGSGAIVGCSLGVILGSVVFPIILWNAYCIILYITPTVQLGIDWPLCLWVVAIYVVAMLLVTWYCCRQTLKEVPAELIRPKAPTSGKKIWLEYFPFWDKIGFLNKVMFRNIFRYRQRLLMMLLGIGGCTALLVTGFGIRDSISDIAVYQFDEVTQYDMAVYFSQDMEAQQQEDFRQALQGKMDQVLFLHQSNVEMTFDGKTRDVYLIAADDALTNFMDLHSGKKMVPLPGPGEAVISTGAAELMGIRIGDRVTVRNLDMESMDVTVSGIYDNHVYNYVIVRPETVEAQWGAVPEQQTAYVTTLENRDVHETSAIISGMDTVMSVAVSADLEASVASMMEALDLVVVTVVICAGLLAVIVLYNLTNINIKERIREIATIKVLGFNAGETAAYVFKENLLLSAFGALFGLVGGKFLLDFVMSQIKIDMVWLQARVSWPSFVLSIVMTMLAACAVDFIFYFRLEKINMAEALKSVE